MYLRTYIRFASHVGSAELAATLAMRKGRYDLPKEKRRHVPDDDSEVEELSGDAAICALGEVCQRAAGE
jgi:hypothetical protein